MDTAHTSKALGRDLTSGGLHRNIWRLALPMVLETGVLNIPQIAETYWVGKELGSSALAAVTISITIRWMVNSLSNGLGIGGMAVVARRVGERNREAAEHATWQTIFLGLMMSLALTAVGLVIARPLLTLLGAKEDVLPLGVDYLRVSFGGLFTLILIFVINAMLRGAGEAGLAMWVLFLAAGVTTALQPILIKGWGPISSLGVAGSAWATILGFGAGVLLQIAVLLRGNVNIGINLHDLKPDFTLMWHIIRIALPSTIQMTLRSSSRLFIVGIVAAYGTGATAGYGVANRMLLIALVPGFGFGNAAGTLVGQNLGARKPDRAERSAWWVSAYTATLLGVMAIGLYIFSDSLIAEFDKTPEVVAYGADCLRVVAPTLVASAVGVVLARSFDGAGNTVPAMVINFISLWATEVPLAYGLSEWTGLGAGGVWWGRGLANVANGMFFAIWFKRGGWKKKEV